MALKLLNPGLRPLGLFDLEDDSAGALEGGELVELAAMTAGEVAVEGYAADVLGVGPLSGGTGVQFAPASHTAGNLCGLADEGTDEYGTLFGTMIGGTVGQGTGLGALSARGTVVLGPSTDRASGKVTVWHQAGLYGVNGAASDDAATPLTGLAANASLSSTAAGLWTTTAIGGNACAAYVGSVTDSSLVSTTNTAAGAAAATEYHAIYFVGGLANQA
jgi:hypothetical protein